MLFLYKILDSVVFSDVRKKEEEEQEEEEERKRTTTIFLATVRFAY